MLQFVVGLIVSADCCGLACFWCGFGCCLVGLSGGVVGLLGVCGLVVWLRVRLLCFG